MADCIDMIDGIFGKTAVGGEPVGAMAFGAVAVVEAGRIFADYAVFTAATTLVNLNRDTITDFEFICTLPHRRNGTGIFMSDDKFTEGRLFGHAFGDNFDITGAHTARFDLN